MDDHDAMNLIADLIMAPLCIDSVIRNIMLRKHEMLVSIIIIVLLFHMLH